MLHKLLHSYSSYWVDGMYEFGVPQRWGGYKAHTRFLGDRFPSSSNSGWRGKSSQRPATRTTSSHHPSRSHLFLVWRLSLRLHYLVYILCGSSFLIIFRPESIYFLFFFFGVPTGALRHKCPRARHNPMSRIPRGTGSEFKLTDDKPIEWRPQRLATKSEGGTIMIRKPEARQNCSCQRKRVTAGGDSEDSTPNLDLNWNDSFPHASCPQEGCT